MAVDLKRVVLDCGLVDLPSDAQTELIDLVRAELQSRVGTILLDLLPAADNDAFQRAHDQGDNDRALHILASAIPGYTAIVDAEYGTLLEAVRHRAAEIREAAVTSVRRSSQLTRVGHLLRHFEAARRRAYEPEPSSQTFNSLNATRFVTSQPGHDIDRLLNESQPGHTVIIRSSTVDQHATLPEPIVIMLRPPVHHQQLPSGAHLYSATTVDDIAANVITPGSSTSSISPAIIFLAPCPEQA